MTDWAANAEYISPNRDLTSVVYELMIQSLLRDRVLVQDEAFVLSSKLASHFTQGALPGGYNGPRLLDELFDMGTITVLKHPNRAYPDHLRERALREPILARSLYIEENTTKGGRRFVPTRAQRAFHAQLDGILARGKRFQRDVGEKATLHVLDAFSSKLREVLGREVYRKWRRSTFRGLTAQAEEDLLRYAKEPEHALRRAAAAGLDLRVPPGPLTFTRSLGYQVAALYPRHQASAIRKLLQTVFADVFCRNESATGRYSRALCELLNLRDDAGLAEAVRSGPVVRVETQIRIPLRLPTPQSGFAKIVREVRGTEAGKRLRASMRNLGRSPDFVEQEHNWRAVADELAARTARFSRVNVLSIAASTPRGFAKELPQ